MFKWLFIGFLIALPALTHPWQSRFDLTHQEIKRVQNYHSWVKALPSKMACSDIYNFELIQAFRFLKSYGYQWQSPSDYERTLEEFKAFLVNVGLSETWASRAVIPNDPKKAMACGFKEFLPPRCRWTTIAALFAVAEKSMPASATIHSRNVWRPSCYNNSVGGAQRSDHIQARAIDMDFEGPRGPEFRWQFQLNLCSSLWHYSEKGLQVGLGSKTVHLGLFSPKKDRYNRHWKYTSYHMMGDTMSCFDGIPGALLDSKISH